MIGVCVVALLGRPDVTYGADEQNQNAAPSSSTVGQIERDPFGYTGAYTDAGGLVHLGSRYLRTDTATHGAAFLTPDAPTAGMLNPYGYAAGDPVNFVDPSGRSPIGDWLQSAHTFFTAIDMPEWLPYAEIGLGLGGLAATLPIRAAAPWGPFVVATLAFTAQLPSLVDQSVGNVFTADFLSPTARAYADLAVLGGGALAVAAGAKGLRSFVTARRAGAARGTASKLDPAQRIAEDTVQFAIARETVGNLDLSQKALLYGRNLEFADALAASLKAHRWPSGKGVLRIGATRHRVERRIATETRQSFGMQTLESPEDLKTLVQRLGTIGIGGPRRDVPPAVLLVEKPRVLLLEQPPGDVSDAVVGSRGRFFPFNDANGMFEGADELFADGATTYPSWTVLTFG